MSRSSRTRRRKSPPKAAGRLYHVTGRDALPLIAQEGLRGRSYWGCRDIAAYYEQVIEDEHRVPVLLAVDFTCEDHDNLEVDEPGIEEPLTCTLGMSEEKIWREWSRTAQDWQASLELIGSIRCRAPIAPERLFLVQPDGTLEPLVSMLARAG